MKTCSSIILLFLSAIIMTLTLSSCATLDKGFPELDPSEYSTYRLEYQPMSPWDPDVLVAPEDSSIVLIKEKKTTVACITPWYDIFAPAKYSLKWEGVVFFLGQKMDMTLGIIFLAGNSNEDEKYPNIKMTEIKVLCSPSAISIEPFSLEGKKTLAAKLFTASSEFGIVDIFATKKTGTGNGLDTEFALESLILDSGQKFEAVSTGDSPEFAGIVIGSLEVKTLTLKSDLPDSAKISFACILGACKTISKILTDTLGR